MAEGIRNLLRNRASKEKAGLVATDPHHRLTDQGSTGGMIHYAIDSRNGVSQMTDQTTTVKRSRSEIRRALSGAAYKTWDALQELPPQSSISDIERATGLSRPSVIKSINELENEGLLDRRAICPKCSQRRAASECLNCGSHEPPNYNYRLMGFMIGALLGSAALLSAEAANAAGHFANPAINTANTDHGTLATIYDLAARALELSLPEPGKENSPGEDTPPISSLPPSPPTSKQNLGKKDYQVPAKDSYSKSYIEPKTLAAKEKWFAETKAYAERSAKLIGDKSLGVHINAWTLARKNHLREE